MMKYKIVNILLIIILYFCISIIKSNEAKCFQNKLNQLNTDNKFKPIGPFGLMSVYYITTDPNNINIMYAGTNNRMYKTIDEGENWHLLYEIEGNCMDIAQNDSNTMYLGTSTDIYKSTDKGETWINKVKIMVNCFGIEINNNNSNVIYGYGEYPYNEYSVCFMKSDDGGDHWTIESVKDSIGKNSPYFNKNCWAIDENNYQKIYIAYNNSLLRSNDGGSIWYSQNLESVIPAGNYIHCIGVDQMGNIFISCGTGIFKSTDDGENWIELSNSPKNVFVIKNLHNNSDFIIAGGIDTVFISNDKGTTWSSSSLGLIGGGHIETLILRSSTDYIIGNETGIFHTINSGISWYEKNSGISYKNISVLDVSKSNPNILYTAIEEEGIYNSTDRGGSWNLNFSMPNVTSLAIDENYPNIAYAIAKTKENNTEKNRLYKTTDSNLSWKLIDLTIVPLCLKIQNNKILVGCYDENTGLNKLVISTDGGSNWIYSSNFELIPYSIYVDPSNFDILYVGGVFFVEGGVRIGIVIKSTDYGMNWNTIYQAEDVVNSIFIDPLNSNNIYIGSYKGIFKRTDSSNIWKNIYSGEYKTIYIDNNGFIYGRGANKVILSSDDGVTWATYNFNSRNTSQVSRNCFQVDETNNTLYVGTENQGVLSLDLNIPTSIQNIENIILKSYKIYNNYPNPFNNQTVIRYSVSDISKVQIQVYNILGQLITTLVNEDKHPGVYEVFWNGKNIKGEDAPSGLYFYRFKSGKFEDVKKMILLR